MASVYGNKVNGYWRVYINVSVNNSYSATQSKVSFSYGIDWVKSIAGDDDANNYWTSSDTTYVSCTGETTKKYSPTKVLTKSNTGSGYYQYASSYFIVDKGTSAKTVTLKAHIYHGSTRTTYKGTSDVTTTASITAKDHYTVSYNANGGSGAPSSQTKWYGTTLTLSSTKPTRGGYAFTKWNTKSDGSGTSYSSGGSYTANAGATLYAQWSVTNPPTCKASLSRTTLRQGFDNLVVTISNIYKYSGRSISDITVTINGHKLTGTGTTKTFSAGTFTTADRGTRAVSVTIKDNLGAQTTYTNVGNVSIIAPTWKKTVIVPESDLPPMDKNGTMTLDDLQVYNYTSSKYEAVGKNGLKCDGYVFYEVAVTQVQFEADETRYYTKSGDNYIQCTLYSSYDPNETYYIKGWEFDLTLNENQVSDKTSTTPNTNAHPIKIGFRHYESNVSENGLAFYATSRNQNYSNGIYNVMFVSGCLTIPNFNSRVWWSKYNDPLYFPDTNYIEVGSNDTAVQGLTKVGDYLGVVKQSKTTDTAIFLLYPTSFEEDTTFAVRQGVQGVGALSRYSFNILGDETLFLSPQGVMAIVPNQDEEHKVQNRSYFVDGKLLKESSLSEAYSFVFDGKYFIATDGGHVYVLDGNQRNSWGNDKTNLVYECYYLENVPASCFVKYNDTLVFSNNSEVCRFTDSFMDAYSVDTHDTNVPVSAEWSTIFDDDNALHYYKTMQKKGNLISILPQEDETGFVPTSVDEEAFDENKTNFYTVNDAGEFVQCTENDDYDPDASYYIVHYSATKVFVRKDDAELVEIKRSFNKSSKIPSEMFFNKKFKKYKRLQFIIRNDAEEDFGIDTIIKNYTVGNYAKK